ncbi:MAG: hypothetical protein J0I23_03860 [Rhizobiales bacterium]|nr:hypothetical protein [Hyphomicrobiales bacterium]
MAEQDIVERLREVNITRYDEAGEGHVGPCMVEHKNGDYVQHSDHLAVVDKLTAELASLRQQLAEARVTARREALEEAAKVAKDFGPSRPIVGRNPTSTIVGRWEGEQAASAGIASLIRALPHPDREGERE